MTAFLDMIDRYDDGSLLIITYKWNLFIKHNFVKNVMEYIFIFIIYLYISLFIYFAVPAIVPPNK